MSLQFLMKYKIKTSKKINAAPPLILTGGFIVLILLGTGLLMLPSATYSPITWQQSLFTATSATTVTGLVVVDTGTVFTPLGQTIIALLMQFGGIGLMTFAVVTLVTLGGKIGFLQKTIAKEAFNQTDASTLITVAKSVLVFALFVESIGFIILSSHWISELGWEKGLFYGFFHTISAFNNAGFALSPNNLMSYVRDPLVNIVISALFIIGGLGFTVWIDIQESRCWRKLSSYSKIMILGTIIINVTALIAIYLIEYNNPQTLQPLAESEKWLASLGFKL